MAKAKKSKSEDIRLMVVFSDLHSGSRRSLMPPEYTLFEEGQMGQTIKANKQQLWLYDCWQRGWEKVIEYVGADPWAWACLGDAVQGIRHMEELVSTDVTDHMIIFDQLNRPYAELATKRYMTRGTKAHVGDTVEMKLGERLKCEQHPETGQFAADRWLLDVNGFPFLLRHHMETTSREHLRAGGLNRELDNEILAATKRGQPVPKGAVFAHRHIHDEYTDGHSYFVLVCGPWQLTTRYGHTKWSSMLPEPTLSVLDWRDVPAGSAPRIKTFKFSPPPASVIKL